MLADANTQTLEAYGAEAPVVVAGSPLLLAYRDTAHRQLGRSYCERLVGLLHWHVDASITEWKFEMIANPGLRALAEAEAQQARIIVIATRCGEEWSSELRLWLKQCSRERRGCPGAIVLVLSSDPDDPFNKTPDYFALKAEAETGDSAFVIYATGLPVEKSTPFSFAGARRVTPEGCIVVREPAEVTILEQHPAVAFR